jgi:hypothetical protein
MKMGTFGRAAASLAVLAMVASPVAARRAESLTDLRGESAIRAKIEMQRRGFQYKSGSGDDFSTTDYWWHRNDRDCVSVQVVRNRVVTIRDVRASECGEKDSGASTAAVVGAVGLIALGALLFSGKDKDKNPNQQDWQDVEAYRTESGYLRIFREPDRSARVIDEVREGTPLRNYGCDRRNGEIWCKAERQDGRSTGWARDRYLRPIGGQGGGNWGGSGGSGGSGGGYPVRFDDLVGVRGSSAEDAMRDRGFRNVDGFKQGSTAYTIWYRDNSRQCVQVAVANGRVDSAVDIQAHPACR